MLRGRSPSRARPRSAQLRRRRPADGELPSDVVTDESPLERPPAEIYTPFDVGEVKRLSEYVADVEELVEADFFKSGGWKWRLTGGVLDPTEEEINYPGEQALHQIAGRFRQLYADHEPTSYNHILKIVGAHVGESPRRQDAIDAIRDLRRWKREAVQHRGVSFDINGEDLTTEALIDLWLHGHYLHKGNAKADKLDALPLKSVLLSEFMGAISRLSQVFWIGRNVVKPILETPSLTGLTPAAR
jgi:hypothetical protein